MSFVQALKRLITTNESSSTSGSTTTNETNQPTPDNATQTHHSSANSNGSHPNMSPSKSNENFKPLSQGLQKKYARGVQYNMKLVIRGECNTGKSVLWSRLQGSPFVEDYVPSDEIRVATINWSSRICGDAIIKVEVWDVVDKSRKKRRPINPSLKLSNSIDAAVGEVSLDAEFLDVYKSTAGVLLIYDITKPWTWDYIEREIVKIPAHIPVLIIGNQLDMGHHRKVPADKCLSFIEHLNRGTMGSVVRYCESSMRNGFGLQYIHQFLSIPFLQLQRESLLQQLQINARDMDSSLEEIDTYARGSDNNYDLFIDSLASKRRTKQEALAGDAVAKAKPLEEAKRLHDEAVLAAAFVEQQQQQQIASKPLNTIVQVIKKTTETPQVSIKPTLTTKQKLPIVAVQPIVQQVVPKSPARDVPTDIATEKHLAADEYPEPHLSNPLVASTVDDFVPDDNDYETFLVDDNVSPQQHISVDPFARSSAAKLSTTDDENELSANPMVKGFRDQLDSDDEQHHQPIVENEPTEYEPESPTIETMPVPLPQLPPAPIYHQISSDDLDFLDQLSSSKSKQAINATQAPDSQSVQSDSASTKSKKKKTTTTTTTTSKSKKEESSSPADTAKTKKKKKVISTKTNAPVVETAAANKDDDDLESFLADHSGAAGHKNDHDYEHI